MHNRGLCPACRLVMPDDEGGSCTKDCSNQNPGKRPRVVQSSMRDSNLETLNPYDAALVYNNHVKEHRAIEDNNIMFERITVYSQAVLDTIRCHVSKFCWQPMVKWLPPAAPTNPIGK